MSYIQMENKNNIEENPLEDAQFLSKMKKENHFSTPNNYFEGLNEVINHKTLNNSILKFSFDNLSYRIFTPILATSDIILLLFELYLYSFL